MKTQYLALFLALALGAQALSFDRVSLKGGNKNTHLNRYTSEKRVPHLSSYASVDGERKRTPLGYDEADELELEKEEDEIELEKESHLGVVDGEGKKVVYDEKDEVEVEREGEGGGEVEVERESHLEA